MLEWTRGRRPWEGGQKGRPAPGSQRETGAMGRQGGHTDHSNSAVESDSDGGAEIHREIAGSLPHAQALHFSIESPSPGGPQTHNYVSGGVGDWVT